MTVARSIVVLSCVFVSGCFGPPSTETDVNRYSNILNDWEATGLTSHFPKTLLPDAKGVSLSTFPGHLQGGSWIQIRMQLAPTEVKQIYQDASDRAKQFHDGGGATTLLNDRTDGLFSANLRTAGSDSEAFPADYRVFVFEAEPKGNADFRWNHGTSQGVAISKARSEVIYWAESW